MTHKSRRASPRHVIVTVLGAALALLWPVIVGGAAAQHPQRLELPDREAGSSPAAAAVCLYGPAAGMLAVTRSSVWTRLLDVLAYHGWRADVFVHAYDPWSEAVPRSVACNGSNSTNVRDVGMAATAPWRLLQPVQEVVEESGLVPLQFHAGDNDARLAASLAAVTRMWQGAGGKQYRAIIYARHDLWYFKDLDLESLQRVITDPDTIVTHDACAARSRQALPDFMLVNPRAAGRLVQVARQARQRHRSKRRGQCSVVGPAEGAGLKVRRIEVKTPAYSHVDRSGLSGWALPPQLNATRPSGRPLKNLCTNSTCAPAPAFFQGAHFRDAPGTAPGGVRKMCVNGIGAWDVHVERRV